MGGAPCCIRRGCKVKIALTLPPVVGAALVLEAEKWGQSPTDFLRHHLIDALKRPDGDCLNLAPVPVLNPHPERKLD